MESAKPEYTVSLQLMQSKKDYIVRLYFRTVREFATYQYVLNVTQKVLADGHEFTIGGLSIPKMKMPTDGTAVTHHDVPISKTLSPVIAVKRKQVTQQFTVTLKGKTIEVEHAANDGAVATIEVIR
ncbi:MAG: hypothetical protein JNL32_03100 [Candidatus Kapabacteria bacterium]|nr:hypothetical protein [Candidatus Kapabacteria bacterium]